MAAASSSPAGICISAASTGYDLQSRLAYPSNCESKAATRRRCSRGRARVPSEMMPDTADQSEDAVRDAVSISVERDLSVAVRKPPLSEARRPELDYVDDRATRFPRCAVLRAGRHLRDRPGGPKRYGDRKGTMHLAISIREVPSRPHGGLRPALKGADEYWPG